MRQLMDHHRQLALHDFFGMAGFAFLQGFADADDRRHAADNAAWAF
jgi:hypothetical protein